MKLKILKENNKDYNLSILDFLRILDPSKTGKFLRILLNELKFYDKSIAVMQGNVWQLSHQVEVLKGINEEIVNQLIDCLGGVDVINDMEKFEVLCDENLIEVKDVQEYKSLGEISLAVIDAEEKRKGYTPKKELVLKNPNYLILKPLNAFAAKKYGASTKWCTSSREHKTFYEYSENGILLYIISKIDNSKWAVYYELKNKELSWWDSKDILTDGYLVDLPEPLKKNILKYILKEDNPNSFYFDVETQSLSKTVLANCRVSDVEFDVDDEISIDSLVEPLHPNTSNLVWPAGLNPFEVNYESTTTTKSEKIDSMVRKTLEYHYTIAALNDGGEEID